MHENKPCSVEMPCAASFKLIAMLGISITVALLGVVLAAGSVALLVWFMFYRGFDAWAELIYNSGVWLTHRSVLEYIGIGCAWLMVFLGSVWLYGISIDQLESRTRDAE